MIGKLPEILPCPFCGGKATLEECGEGRFSVGCEEVEGSPGLCMGYQSLTVFARRCEAINAWNKRAPALTGAQ